MATCIADISVDTLLVYDRLKKVLIGETITYSEIDQAIGRIHSYGMLYTAKKKLQKEDSIVFSTIRGVGIKRLADADIVNSSSMSFDKIKRATTRERGRLQAVDYNILSQDLKIKHSASAAILAVINNIAKGKQIKAVENKMAESNNRLSMMQTIDVIKASNGAL